MQNVTSVVVDGKTKEVIADLSSLSPLRLYAQATLLCSRGERTIVLRRQLRRPCGLALGDEGNQAAWRPYVLGHASYNTAGPEGAGQYVAILDGAVRQSAFPHPHVWMGE
jgi:hypothetical protein